MAEGLAYAHKRGIVHCDFKPANVFLTRDGVPKILDFGIARAVQVADKSGAGLTTKGDDSVFMGFTPTYAAPDLIAENEPSTSDDVFSLGLVAYELLAGKHPFERKQADVAIKEGLKPVPIKGLKRNEWRAIEKALAYTRAERYPDGAAFVKDFVGRTPLQKTLIGALAASVIAAGVFGWQNYVESQPAVPFETLPAEVQEQFKARVASGQESLDYVAKTGDVSASADAATFFAEAYALHPKNREAVRGLEQAAAYAIPWFTQQPNRSEARAELEKFKGKSEFYNKYKPINEAIEDLK
jgi:serine/threonine protein kinase